MLGPGTIADIWMQERALLMLVPQPVDGFAEQVKRVSSTCFGDFRTRSLQRARLVLQSLCFAARQASGTSASTSARLSLLEEVIDEMTTRRRNIDEVTSNLVARLEDALA